MMVLQLQRNPDQPSLTRRQRNEYPVPRLFLGGMDQEV